MTDVGGLGFEVGWGALALMATYLAGMLLIGWLGRRSRKAESLQDFYLAGSGFGFVVLFLTFFATQYSGNTLLGFSGRAYRQGLTYVVSVTFMVGVVTVYMLYAPRLFRLARRFGYITPADFVFHRYRSHALRVLTVVLLCWGLANYVLEQLVAMGHGVEAITEGRLSFMQGVVLLVVVMLIYESLGGMRSVAWTDVVQGTLLLSGCLVILYLLVSGDGGLPEAAAAVASRAPERVAPPDGEGLRSWISSLLLLSFGVAIYPHAIQRIFAARTSRVLRRSLAVMAFMPLVTTLLAFLVGFVGLSRFPDLPGIESDRITILLLGQLGAEGVAVYWLVVVVLTAVVAAIMSTADSALLAIGSMVTRDLVRPYLWRDATEAQLLRVGKWSAWALMALLVWLAWVSVEAEGSLWTLIRLKLEFMVQLAPAIVLGLHSRRLASRGVLSGMIVGTVVTLVLWTLAAAGVLPRSAVWGVNAGVWGLVANTSLCLLSLVSGRRRSSRNPR